MRAPRRRLLLIAVVAIGVLCSLELAARMMALRFDPATTWFSPAAHERVAYLEQSTWELDQPTTLLVGSSVVASGIDAEQMESLLGGAVINAGVPAANAEVVERWTLEQVLTRIPREVGVERVVYGLTTAELNGNSRADPLERYEQQIAIKPGWRGRLHRGAFATSALVRHSDAWTDPVDAFDALRTAPDADRLTVSFFDSPLPPRIDLANRPDPNDLANQLVDFSLEGDQLAALDRLAVQLAERGIDLVVVLTPVHSGYAAFHPGGEQGFEVARHAIIDHATASGAQVVDLSAAFGDEVFIDHVHLDRRGSALVAELLACELDGACP